ncbi:hypothetical protein QZH47_31180 (plasmid) [Pseudomonas corrugata]
MNGIVTRALTRNGVYVLGNGTGKARAKIEDKRPTGAERRFVVSPTGEKTLAQQHGRSQQGTGKPKEGVKYARCASDAG